jgi:hypothetical protein
MSGSQSGIIYWLPGLLCGSLPPEYRECPDDETPHIAELLHLCEQPNLIHADTAETRRAEEPVPVGVECTERPKRRKRRWILEGLRKRVARVTPASIDSHVFGPIVSVRSVGSENDYR